MASEATKAYAPRNLSLIIGTEDEEGDSAEESLNVRTLSLVEDAELPPTVFLEDEEAFDAPPALEQNEPVAGSSTSEMGNFAREFFSSGGSAQLFQPVTQGNFIEEIYAEKAPKVIGDYLFGSMIGEGSYSKVKEVLHTKKLIRRAIKIIKDKRLRKIPCGEANVQREIELLRRIKHPNVVELLEVFRVEEKEKLYIVMEFCVCSLQQMLDNCPEKRLPEFQAHMYFTQLLDGLDYLHQNKRIIHKDIKPGNLLLSLDGRIKICDMGVAEVLEGKDPDDDWFELSQGTPKFQPPEIVSGSHRRFRGRPVDLWACGVTLYNLVSGNYPFDGDVIMRLFESIVNNPLRMPENVELSSGLTTLLTGLLEKDPERRWNSVQIRISEWFRHGQPVVGEGDILSNNYSSKPMIEKRDSTLIQKKAKIVSVPEIRGVPAHRPLGVMNALEQLYGSHEDNEKELAEGRESPAELRDITLLRVREEHFKHTKEQASNVTEEKEENAPGNHQTTGPGQVANEQTRYCHSSWAATSGASEEAGAAKPSKRILRFFQRRNFPLPNFLQRLLL